MILPQLLEEVALARSSRSIVKTEGDGKTGNLQKPPRSQTLLRGFEIIDAVSQRPLTISEIAAAVGLSYQTSHRLVSVLTEQRYLQSNEGRHFGLGPRLIELGFGPVAVSFWSSESDALFKGDRIWQQHTAMNLSGMRFILR